jgi:hypothetical protein
VDCLEHPVQMRDRPFDVSVLVLPGPALRREQRTSMNLLEVAVWKFVMRLGIVRLVGVDAEKPFTVFAKAVALDEGVLLLRRRWCSLQASRSSMTTRPSSISARA